RRFSCTFSSLAIKSYLECWTSECIFRGVKKRKNARRQKWMNRLVRRDDRRICEIVKDHEAEKEGDRQERGEGAVELLIRKGHRKNIDRLLIDIIARHTAAGTMTDGKDRTNEMQAAQTKITWITSATGLIMSV
uniref:Uncharacterized protein n=1 Tax=Parascaris univalens TaxID=6257 RepID=A0A915CAW0_PARUN